MEITFRAAAEEMKHFNIIGTDIKFNGKVVGRLVKIQQDLPNSPYFIFTAKINNNNAYKLLTEQLDCTIGYKVQK